MWELISFYPTSSLLQDQDRGLKTTSLYLVPGRSDRSTYGATNTSHYLTVLSAEWIEVVVENG